MVKHHRDPFPRVFSDPRTLQAVNIDVDPRRYSFGPPTHSIGRRPRTARTLRTVNAPVPRRCERHRPGVAGLNVGVAGAATRPAAAPGKDKDSNSGPPPIFDRTATGWCRMWRSAR